MRAFKLQPESGIPLTLQLREQIRYQIRSGLIKPGAPLPSLRDLAAGLGLNRNTIIRALADLEDEGLVVAEHGRGHFATLEPPAAGARLRAVVGGALAQARELGLSPEEAALSLLAHSQIAGPAAPLHRVLLLVSHPADTIPLRTALESALPVAVTPWLAHDPPPPAGGGPYHLVVTPLAHGAAAAALAGTRPTGLLAPPPLRTAWAALAGRPPDAPVTVVGRDWVEAGRFRQSLAGVAPQLHRIALAVAGPDLPAALAGTGLVICPQALQPLIQSQLPAGATVLAEPLTVDAAALAELAALLAVPTRPAPVSPWF